MAKVTYCFLLFLCFIGCRPKPEPLYFRGMAMTIPYCVQVGDAHADATDIETILLATFTKIHQIYNNWNPESEVSRLNQLPAYEKMPLSAELAAFLSYVDQIVTLTEGRFDPTVEPLQHIWKQCLKRGELPDPQVLTEIYEAVGWKNVHFDDGLFYKEHAHTAIDLGGIAKGYAVDLLVENLYEASYRSIYVEWGGEIRTAGQHPSGRPWTIGIEHLSTIELSDRSIATSGAYIQNWNVNNISYTHIIDPRTKQPIQNAPITSVSVIAPTCAEADALATALMLFPSKQAAESWAKERDLKVFIY